MATANINPQMLIWARERLGFSMPEFAKKLPQKEEKLASWENSEAKPTFRQAMDFAKKAHIPFAYLFLPEPPVEKPLLADLRTLGSQHSQHPYSAELKDLIKLMQGRQAWYKDFILAEGATELEFVGSYAHNFDVLAIAQDIRNKLDLTNIEQRGSWEDYYRLLIQRIEQLGVLVMRQGFLGHHTRPLRVEEFRGFALVDSIAPLIFINHADAPGPRLFTLLHELAHVWIGVSGISDNDVMTERTSEVVCNAVAAEFLVPGVEFQSLWRTDLDVWHEQLTDLAQHFLVSKWVIARRALTFSFITADEYQQFINNEKEAFQQRSKQDGGPTYYLTKKSQISNRFATAIVSDAINGNTPLREAASLMDTALFTQEAEQDCLIDQALADVDAGRVIDHEAVQNWANSLNTNQPLPAPTISN